MSDYTHGQTMSYKPQHVAKLKTSSGKKKIEEEDLPLLHTPYSEVNASTTVLDTRGTPQLYAQLR
jgi:hypothetical protein